MYQGKHVCRRPEILPRTAACYEHETSRYPEHIRVSFDDGKTLIYDVRVDHPAPQVMRAIELIHKMASESGYICRGEVAL